MHFSFYYKGIGRAIAATIPGTEGHASLRCIANAIELIMLFFRHPPYVGKKKNGNERYFNVTQYQWREREATLTTSVIISILFSSFIFVWSLISLSTGLNAGFLFLLHVVLYFPVCKKKVVSLALFSPCNWYSTYLPVLLQHAWCSWSSCSTFLRRCNLSFVLLRFIY